MVSAHLNYIWEWSIRYDSLSTIFIPLHSSMNQELFKKYVCNQSSHYEKYDIAVRPSYRLKPKYPFPFSANYVQLVTQQYKPITAWKCTFGLKWNISWIPVIQILKHCFYRINVPVGYFDQAMAFKVEFFFCRCSYRSTIMKFMNYCPS